MANDQPPPGDDASRKITEIVVAAALLGVLAVLLVPLPPMLLDYLLTLNIGFTLVLLLITLNATQPLDVSVFPALLLFLTLFRLALNVATTRLILLTGHAGDIVSSFGNYVVGGNLVVGLVVFLILVIIQFVVITRGAGRISEVAARFTLDALPGKQMAIDAELNAGAIDEIEAKRRRQHLMREAEFHGAMDGASKFVRGDAIAGLIITAINLIGGILLGITRGMEIVEALRSYSILTVGDGLVTQIPALIIATASGFLVTKSTSQSSLGQEIKAQVALHPRPLQVGAVIMFALAFTGLPPVPFVALGAALFFGARRLAPKPEAPKPDRLVPTSPDAPTPASGAQAAAPTPVVDDFVQQQRVCVEIGLSLLPILHDTRRKSKLTDRIGKMRRDMAQQSGIWVPTVMIRDEKELGETYRILINGREVGRGQIRPNYHLAISEGQIATPLEGEVTQEPTFGLPARWIAETEVERARFAGYSVVDPQTVLITHLRESLRRHAGELLSREDLKELLDKVRQIAPSTVDELMTAGVSHGILHRVLILLLEECVPISNITRILESVAMHAPYTKDPVELAERARGDLGSVICERLRDEQRQIHVIVLDPRLELEMKKTIHERQLSVDPNALKRFMVCLANEWRRAGLAGREISVLVDAPLRRPLRSAIARTFTDLPVLSYVEIPHDLNFVPAGMIRLEDVLPAPTPMQVP